MCLSAWAFTLFACLSAVSASDSRAATVSTGGTLAKRRSTSTVAGPCGRNEDGKDLPHTTQDRKKQCTKCGHSATGVELYLTPNNNCFSKCPPGLIGDHRTRVCIVKPKPKPKPKPAKSTSSTFVTRSIASPSYSTAGPVASSSSAAATTSSATTTTSAFTAELDIPTLLPSSSSTSDAVAVPSSSPTSEANVLSSTAVLSDTAIQSEHFSASDFVTVTISPSSFSESLATSSASSTSSSSSTGSFVSSTATSSSALPTATSTTSLAYTCPSTYEDDYPLCTDGTDRTDITTDQFYCFYDNTALSTRGTSESGLDLTTNGNS